MAPVAFVLTFLGVPEVFSPSGTFLRSALPGLPRPASHMWRLPCPAAVAHTAVLLGRLDMAPGPCSSLVLRDGPGVGAQTDLLRLESRRTKLWDF